MEHAVNAVKCIIPKILPVTDCGLYFEPAVCQHSLSNTLGLLNKPLQLELENSTFCHFFTLLSLAKWKNAFPSCSSQLCRREVGIRRASVETAPLPPPDPPWQCIVLSPARHNHCTLLLFQSSSTQSQVFKHCVCHDVRS